MPPRRPISLGVSVTPEAARADEIVRVVRAAEAGGLAWCGIQDHPYQPRFLDTFALLGVLAARTTRIHLFPDVANLPLRPPAMLAKAVASLDVLSGGRIELGIGAGAFWDAIAGMGGPRRTPGEAFGALVEALEVLPVLWDARGPVSREGAQVRLDGYRPGPAPAHPVEVWVGAAGPRSLDAIGRLADGWLPSLGRFTPEALRAGQERIDRAAEAAGRDPARVRRLCNVGGRIADRAGGGELDGPPELWAERLRALSDDLGIDTWIVWPEGGDPEEQVVRLAAEVMPLLA